MATVNGLKNFAARLLSPAPSGPVTGAGTVPGQHDYTAPLYSDRHGDTDGIEPSQDYGFTQSFDAVSPYLGGNTDIIGTGQAADLHPSNTGNPAAPVVERSRADDSTSPLPSPTGYGEASDVAFARMNREVYVAARSEDATPVTIGLVKERVLGSTDRPSQLVESTSLMERPFDRLMGVGRWPGTKAALDSPQAWLPNTYPDPIHDPIPTPAGSSPTVPNTPSLTPQKQTSREVPGYWASNYVSGWLA